VRIGLRLPACDRADRVAAAAAHAEAAGFDSVWVPDSQLLWRDAFVALAFAAASTTRIALATGVTNLVTRHVTVVASAARTVQELAPGRFTLALGAGRSAADMAGATHTPTRDLGESLRALRALLSGQPWSFAGRPQRLTGAAGACPVYLGAGGPRNVRLACAEADGIILAGTLSVADVTRTAAMIRALAARSSRPGRPGRPFDVVLWLRAHVHDGSRQNPRQWKPAVAIALRNAPEAIADSLGVDRRALRQAAGLHSDGTHPAAWAEAVASCDPLISDDAAMAYAQRYCLYGTPADIRRRITELERAGVTTLITTPLTGDTAGALPEEFIDSFAATGLTS
jgi:5,10-methylenetetrahydromethanopterin reductase